QLMDRAARPGPAEIGCKTPSVEIGRDHAFAATLMDKGAVDIADQCDFFVRPGREDHPVGLDALVLATDQHPLDRAMFVDQRAPQTKPGRAALTKTLFDQPALPGKHLG